jgi:transposase
MNNDEELNRLRQENQTLREGLKQALMAIDYLQERVAELERQQAKDSHNSSLPRSSDGLVRPTKSLRHTSGKQPGGQAGQQGHHLEPVEMADQVVMHEVARCEQCQCDLGDVAAQFSEPRQVVDLPVVRLWVSEQRVEEKRCPQCSHVTRAAFPPTITAPVQYGTPIQALAVYLVEGQAVPYARASQLLQEGFGVHLSAGRIATFVRTCHQQLAEVERQITAALMTAAVIHQDETGLRVGSMGQWVHVCSTEHLTHSAAHPKRGREALGAIGLLEHFTGTSVHDGLASYQAYSCRHALCHVHHLRELTLLEEELKQPWAAAMKALLLDMQQAVEQARAAGKHELDVLALGRFHRRYDLLLAQGYAANPPPPSPKKVHGGRTKQHPARNLLDRLSNHKWQVLVFLHDFAVPFDNNQAERDLRMIKVPQKVSGCFRSEDGVARFCRIRSYLSTLRKQGQHLLWALEQTLAGHPLLPALGTPPEELPLFRWARQLRMAAASGTGATWVPKKNSKSFDKRIEPCVKSSKPSVRDWARRLRPLSLCKSRSRNSKTSARRIVLCEKNERACKNRCRPCKSSLPRRVGTAADRLPLTTAIVNPRADARRVARGLGDKRDTKVITSAW